MKKTFIVFCLILSGVNVFADSSEDFVLEKCSVHAEGLKDHFQAEIEKQIQNSLVEVLTNKFGIEFDTPELSLVTSIAHDGGRESFFVKMEKTEFPTVKGTQILMLNGIYKLRSTKGSFQYSYKPAYSPEAYFDENEKAWYCVLSLNYNKGDWTDVGNKPYLSGDIRIANLTHDYMIYSGDLKLGAEAYRFRLPNP